MGGDQVNYSSFMGGNKCSASGKFSLKQLNDPIWWLNDFFCTWRQIFLPVKFYLVNHLVSITGIFPEHW